jgi:murein DD-endopeptidase MepM/ murein hydrolase activator NlpD
VRFFKLDALNVAAEDRVSVGDVIGTVGRTGIATGPHLHYEIWVRGMALDPAAILKAGGVDYEGL